MGEKLQLNYNFVLEILACKRTIKDKNNKMINWQFVIRVVKRNSCSNLKVII